jgi:hypothetical protein
LKKRPSREAEPKGSSGFGRFLAHATDPLAFRWPAIVTTLVAFAIVQMVTALRGDVSVVWSAVFRVVFATWVLLWVFLLIGRWAFLARSWARRHPMLGATFIFISVVIAGVVAAVAVPGSAGTDGWTFLWRAVITFTALALWSVLQEY